MMISVTLVKQVRKQFLEKLAENPPDKFSVDYLNGVFLFENITSFNYFDGKYQLSYPIATLSIDPGNINSFYTGNDK